MMVVKEFREREREGSCVLRVMKNDRVNIYLLGTGETADLW